MLFIICYTQYFVGSFLNFRIFIHKGKIMSKEIREYIDTFRQKILKENEEFNENDTTEYVDCLYSLKKVNNGIHRMEVILWFKENDIDYFNMTELEMYIYYIEKNASM
jgi:hypothetical protein